MRSKFLVFFIFIQSFAFGQMKDFKFKREIKAIDDQWHTLSIPNEMYSKISTDLSDIRVFGINAKKDTIEAAYVWKNSTTKLSEDNLSFKILNESFTKEGKFYTFQLDKNTNINEINLEFNNKNFNWNLDIDASNDQNQWFTVSSNYRIVSIKNNATDFSFTKLLFPESSYKFYRIHVKTNEKVDLKSAQIQYNRNSKNSQRTYKTAQQKIYQDKKTKQTIVEVDLEMPVFMNEVEIAAKNSFDYYRPITVEYLTDSIKTENYYRYIYENMGSGTLNSLGKNDFPLENTIAKKFRIIIENGNNQILDIASIQFKGNENTMVIRFLEPADYFLVYGKKNAQQTNFDLSHFVEKIPENASQITLGEEQNIDQKSAKQEPLFENKMWLWTVMALIIALLGWFTLKMMKKEESK